MLSPLTHAHYRRLLVSNALWWPTIAMWTVIAGSLVLDMTNSALAVALLSFWRRAAQLTIGGFAGPIGDHLGRRTTLVATQGLVLLSMVAILLLFFAQQLDAWHMTAAAFMVGAAWTVDMPARSALVPDLVGREQTVDAMLLESFVQGIVASGGAFLAGWLLDELGPAGAFGVLVGLTGLNVGLLIRLSRLDIPQTVPMPGQSVWRAIGEGATYVRYNRPILAVILISTVLNILIFPSISLLPVFARDVLGRGALGLGLLSAGYSLGSFAGLYAISRLRHRWPIGRLFIAGTLLQCTSLVLFAGSRSYLLSWALLFAAGVGQAGFHTLRNAILLTSATDQMRGRAMSLVVLTQGAGLPGELQTGLLAESIGAPITVGIQAGVAGLGSTLIALAVPSLRRPDPHDSSNPHDSSR